MSRNITSFLRERFLTIDTRTLGLARIGIALLLLFDLAKRAAGLSIWYTDLGLLPNSLLDKHPFRPFGWSFLFHLDAAPVVRVVFLLIAVVYLCFLLGLFTRVMHVLSFICLVSLQIRIDLLSNGGDFVFCDLVLWTAFLPMGATFSIDAWRRNKAGKPVVRSPHVSWAVLVALLQLAVIYWFNAVHKTGETWQNGTAVYWLAQQERIVTGLGHWMRDHLPLWTFQFMAYQALVIEYALPFLILLPVGRPWTRRLAIVGIWVLHLAIAAVSNVGLFSFVMIAYSLLLVSPEDWNWLRDRLAVRRGKRAPIVQAMTLPPEEKMGDRAPRPLRWAGNLLLLYLFVVATSQVLVENGAVPKVLKHDQPKWIRATVQSLRLNQGWSMFARDAPRDDMWLVVDAVTADGRHVDPYNELASRHADPTLRSIPERLGQNYHFCDYTVRIKHFRVYHPAFVDWLYRYHERTGDESDRIESFVVYEITQIPPAPGATEPHSVKARPFLSRRR